MGKEIWKPISGYEGLYEVSSHGRVSSLNSSVKVDNYIKVPQINQKGYHRVELCVARRRKSHGIHRLVAQAFIPNPENKPEVNHKDENKSNNFIENLEWMSHIENSNYGTRNRRVAEANTNGKMSKKVGQFTLDGLLVKIWPSTMEASRAGYSQSKISKCGNNKHNTHKGFIWKYLEESHA